MLEHLYNSIIMEELGKIPGIKLGKRYSMILCPYHNEKTPSGRIRHDPNKPGFGSFKCYGCRKSVRWNDLAATLGLRQVGKGSVKVTEADVPKTSTNRYEEAFFHEDSAASVDDLKFFSLTGTRAKDLGLVKEWRGFALDFLSETIGARLSYFAKRRVFYVFLPVYIKGQLEGFINAQIEKPKSKKYPSYYNAPGSWSLSKGLFPFDACIALMNEKNLTTVVLVEGPRDALRLIRKGIPAMCILGTHSWSDSKARLLEFAGVARVVLMMDGDDAGKAAARLIKTGLDPGDNPADFKPLRDIFDVKTVKLWDVPVPDTFPEGKYDPGNCPDWILDSVYERLVN